MKKKYLIPLILVLISIQSCSNFTELKTGTTTLNEKSVERISTVPASDSFSFVVFGDNREGFEIYEKIVAFTNELNPFFTINTGDLVPDGSYSSYLRFLSMSEKLNMPYFVCAGNHDIRNNGRKYYRNIFGPSDFFFDYANCRFIIIDNSTSYLTDSQLSWLEQRLLTSKHKFIFMHYPPEIGNWHHTMTYNNKKFIKMMEKHDVDYVFCGHIHCYDKYVKNGVTYVITGGAGAAFGLERDVSGEYINHLMVVEVNGDVIQDTMIKVEPGAYSSPANEKFRRFKKLRRW